MITGTISIFATIVALLALSPIVNTLGSPNDYDELWTDASSEAISARNNAFHAYLGIGAMLIGSIILWMFLSVVRRDFTDF